MAHQLDMSKGRPAFLAAKEGGWHGLGSVTPDYFDKESGYVGAGHAFDVVKEPLYYKGVKVPGRFATVRTDTEAVLGVVKSRYQVFQNSDLWNFADKVVGEGKACYDTAGALRGGKAVWVLANLGRAFDVVPGDQVETYMLFLNTHDGSGLCSVMTTTVRVVCNNTLTAAFKGAAGKRVRVRHTGALDMKVAAAQEALAKVVGEVEHLQGAMKTLAAKQLNHTELANYFATLLVGRGERGAKKVGEKLFELFDNKRQTMPGVTGTAWAAYNAVSEYVDWQSNFRTADSTFESVLYGHAAALKQQAFDLALALSV